MNYDILEHVHRLAAWAASRAASTVKGKRFEVQAGKAMLEVAGMDKVLGCGPDKLPDSPEAMDSAHAQWRAAVIEAAAQIGHDFSHGMAAKLINVYLKVGFVTVANSEHHKVALLHPPIDRELLNGLAKADKNSASKWAKHRNEAWSTFSSAYYEAVIADIRSYLNDKPLWMIEESWQGFQGNAPLRTGTENNEDQDVE